MKAVIQRRNDCRGCSSHNLDLVFSLKPSPIGDAFVGPDKISIPQPTYPIDLYMCRSCGLAQLIDVIDPDILYGDYLYVTSSSLGLDEHFRNYARNVAKRCGLAPNSLVIDLGSNDGTLLRQFKDLKLQVVGVEPATHIAQKATADGVQTIGKFFNTEVAREIVAEFGHAKVVTANNVFANIDNLMSWVTAINELLAEDGVFVFESYYLADLVNNMVFDFLYHEHLSSFSVKPIQMLFRRVGLELVAVEHIATKGGSLRYFVQRPGGPLSDDGSVLRARNNEDQIGLYEKATFTTFENRINRLKHETLSFLDGAKRAGQRVAGFGASITGTTLIYHFELGEYLEFLIDDNSAKQGRFSPGHHLPVLPTEAIYDRKPDYILILAWRYAEPFIRKHPRFYEGGGGFVIPVPVFKVLKNV